MHKLFVVIFFLVLTNCSIAQSIHNNLPVVKTLKQNEEITILLGPDLNRIVVNFQNVINNESVVYRTMYVGDQECPENEIGPKEYRMISLAPIIKDDTKPIRLDKKELVLNKGNADKIIIRVKKGEVNIHVKPYKRKI